MVLNDHTWQVFKGVGWQEGQANILAEIPISYAQCHIFLKCFQLDEVTSKLSNFYNQCLLNKPPCKEGSNHAPASAVLTIPQPK